MIIPGILGLAERILEERYSAAKAAGTTIVLTLQYMDIQTQITWLFILAIPIASISWTVTHEEVFREPREFCVRQSKHGRLLAIRKFFYLFTCEYCFSHYVTVLMLLLTQFTLLYDDWRGYIISGFALVWVANVYMSLYAFIRVDIKKERILAKKEEEKLKS